MNRIKLGDKVRSTVSGFSGTVTAICHYLYNESQYCVKSNALVNGDEKVCWFSIGELTTAPECEMGECDKYQISRPGGTWAVQLRPREQNKHRFSIMAELVRTVNFSETFAALRLGESVEFSVAEFTESSVRANASRYCKGKNIKLSVSALRGTGVIKVTRKS